MGGRRESDRIGQSNWGEIEMKVSWTFEQRTATGIALLMLFVIALTTVGCVNPKQEIRQEVRQHDRDAGRLDVGDPLERKAERKVDRKF
jgi:hypothetical protein